MLRQLELQNFLLFEKAVFTFSGGLNAVSGETGAGKSLVARALGLALGGRGGGDIIRSGCEEARIKAVLHRGAPWPESIQAVADGQDTLVVERTIRRDGSGLTLNGRAVTAQLIRQNLSPLVDFAAQNEHTRLADPAYQLVLLDRFGRLDGPCERYAGLYGNAAGLYRRLHAGRQEKEMVRIRLERAKAELAELEALAFDPHSDPLLEGSIREMSHAASVVQAAAEAVDRLEGGDDPAMDAVAAAWKTVERLADISPRLTDAAQALAAGLESIETAVASLRSMAEDMDTDPARLDSLIARSEKLKGLAKRFECPVASLDKAAERLEQEIAGLSDWDAGEEELARRLEEVLPEVAAAGKELGQKRRLAAKRLSKAVNRELAGLGMPEAGFEVSFEPVWQDGMPLTDLLGSAASGLDEIGFYISPNPGEAPSAVATAASGGEASRAVLAIKAALSTVYTPGLMFLDEVDAGVGSRLGRELGAKLRELAESRQVIVITHLPQIAAFADNHLKVGKSVRGGRTIANVQALDGEERVDEIAKMIHGDSASAITVQQARDMLRQGGMPPADQGESA